MQRDKHDRDVWHRRDTSVVVLTSFWTFRFSVGGRCKKLCKRCQLSCVFKILFRFIGRMINTVTIFRHNCTDSETQRLIGRSCLRSSVFILLHGHTPTYSSDNHCLSDDKLSMIKLQSDKGYILFETNPFKIFISILKLSRIVEMFWNYFSRFNTFSLSCLSAPTNDSYILSITFFFYAVKRKTESERET